MRGKEREEGRGENTKMIYAPGARNPRVVTAKISQGPPSDFTVKFTMMNVNTLCYFRVKTA